MTMNFKSDTSRPGGGYAILAIDTDLLPISLAIEDRSNCLFLGLGGKWTKQPHYFKVEMVDSTSVRLGPEIVDYVEADTIVGLHGEGGKLLGVQVWPAIRPSAGASSGFVMPNRLEMAVATAVAEVVAATPAAASATPAHSPVATFDELPPLPQPPLMSNIEPIVPRLKPAGHSSGLLKPLLIGNGVALLILFLVFFRGTDAARGLVCEPNSPLAGAEIAKTLISCPAKPAFNPEAAAYTDYLQCLPSKPVCAQKACSDVYLSKVPIGNHAEQVRAAAAESQRSCVADADKKTAADNFAAFNECLRANPNVCSRAQCVDRFRYKLTIEPYASSLRQAADLAANDCRRQQEDAGFAEFNRCVAGAAACDTARCASAFTSANPTSAYISRVLQTAENAARTCAAARPAPQQLPSPPQVNSAEQATRSFIARYYYSSSSQGEAAGASLSNFFASNVTFYGKPMSGAAVMREKSNYNKRWNQRSFSLRDDSLSVVCNSSGGVCRATGQVLFDVASTSPQRNARGLSSFDFLVADPQSDPKVVGESGNVLQRY